MSAFTDALEALNRPTAPDSGGAVTIPDDQTPPDSPYAAALGDLAKTAEQRKAALPPPAGQMSNYDFGRAMMTAGVRGITGLASSLSDPLAGLRRLVSPELAKIEAGEQAQATVPLPTEIARRAGDAVFSASGVPEYEPTTPQGRAGMGALTGAVAGAPFGPAGVLLSGLSGALGPVTKDITGSDRWSEAASLAPGLLAAPAQMAAGAARNRVAQRLTPELYDAGVTPTIGQLLGGRFGRYEEGISGYPFAGDFIRNARRDAVDQASRGPMVTGLRSIGEQLNPDTLSGNPAVFEAQTKLGQAYDAITPHLTVTIDPQFLTTDMTRINRRTSMLRPEQQADFGRYFQAEVIDRLQPGGVLDGPSFRAAESEIGRVAQDNIHSAIPADRELGRTLMDLQGSLRDLQMRSNPEHAVELQRIHDAYADFQRVQRAASYIGADTGISTPGQLYRATRELDNSLGHRVFAGGQARMQDYAQAAKTLLGDKVPDSGTASRSAALALPFVIGSGFVHPAAAVGTAAAAAGLGALYSGRGRRYITDFLHDQPTGMPPMLSGLLAGQAAQPQPASADPMAGLLKYIDDLR